MALLGAVAEQRRSMDARLPPASSSSSTASLRRTDGMGHYAGLNMNHAGNYHHPPPMVEAASGLTSLLMTEHHMGTLRHPSSSSSHRR